MTGGAPPFSPQRTCAHDPEARIYVIAEAVRAWCAVRGVPASVRRSRSSASRYVELRTVPAPGAPDGWPVLTIRVSDHPSAPDGAGAALTIYPGTDPAACEAQLEAALEAFQAAAGPL